MTALESDLRTALQAGDAGRVHVMAAVLHHRAATGAARLLHKPSKINDMKPSRITYDTVREHLTATLEYRLTLTSPTKVERGVIQDGLDRRNSNAGKGFTSTRRAA